MSNELHVVPRGDLIAHDDTDACACGPTTEPVQRDDGSTGWIVVHHALDGRDRKACPVDPHARPCVGGHACCSIPPSGDRLETHVLPPAKDDRA